MRCLFFILLALPLLAEGEVVVAVTQDTTLHMDLGGGNFADKPVQVGTTLSLLDANPEGHKGQILVEDKENNVKGYIDANTADLVTVKDNVSTAAQDLATAAKSQPSPIVPTPSIVSFPDPTEPPIDELIEFIQNLYDKDYYGQKQPPPEFVAQMVQIIQQYGIHNLIEIFKYDQRYFNNDMRASGNKEKIKSEIIIPAIRALLTDESFADLAKPFKPHEMLNPTIATILFDDKWLKRPELVPIATRFLQEPKMWSSMYCPASTYQNIIRYSLNTPATQKAAVDFVNNKMSQIWDADVRYPVAQTARDTRDDGKLIPAD